VDGIERANDGWLDPRRPFEAMTIEWVLTDMPQQCFACRVEVRASGETAKLDDDDFAGPPRVVLPHHGAYLCGIGLGKQTCGRVRRCRCTAQPSVRTVTFGLEQPIRGARGVRPRRRQMLVDEAQEVAVG